MADNALYYGDNLTVMRDSIEDESVDLIYLDPPFNSQQDYNVLFAERDGTRSEAQIQAFEDTWVWDEGSMRAFVEVVEEGPQKVSEVMQAFRGFLGDTDMLAYLAMMAPRLVEMHRCLRETGSLYLHCDPAASHYLKLLLDAVFGPTRFRSEIIWRRSTAHNKLSRQYGPIHDTLLFYSKGDEFTFHPGRTPYTRSYIEGRFTREDSGGRYRSNELTGSGIRGGSSGQPWRGFDPTPKGRHWAIPASLREFLPNDGKGMSSQEKLDYLADLPDSHIIMPEDDAGWPSYRQYIGPGVPYQDVWAYQPGTRGVLWGTEEGIDEDVRWLEAGEEKLEYPTQKPEGLLERIILTSSDEGEVVMDPFCGCGTAVAAAQNLRRKWIGIDITHLAVHLIKHRLVKAHGDSILDEFEVHGEPTDLAGAIALAKQDRHEFELWALGQVGARSSSTGRGADKGIDGRLYFHDDQSGKTRTILLSVKSGKASVGHVRELRAVVEREDAEIGVLITLEQPTKPERDEATAAGFYASPWNTRHSKIQILTVEELLDGARIDYPETRHGNVTYKDARRYQRKVAEQLHLGDGD